MIKQHTHANSSVHDLSHYKGRYQADEIARTIVCLFLKKVYMMVKALLLPSR